MALSSSQTVAAPRVRSVRQHEYPGQSHWPGPGIFVKVELGLSFSPTRSRQLSFEYATRNMEERVRNQRQPVNLELTDRSLGAGISQRQMEDDERARATRRRRMRSRSALQLRTSPVSPEAVTLSTERYDQRDYHPFHPEPVYLPEPVYHPSPVSVRDHRPSQLSQSTYRSSPISLGTFSPQHANSYPPPQTPQATSSRMPPFAAAVRQSTIDRKPLPPLPSRFRLGSDDLPWSSPTILDPNDITYTEPSNISTDEPWEQVQPPPPAAPAPAPAPAPSAPLVDDPQRTRDLEQLHQAMLGVDSTQLGNDWWEPGGSWDRHGDLGGLPSGPRGVGWAVAVPTTRPPQEEEQAAPFPPPSSRTVLDDFRSFYESDAYLSPPPAYSQGQWGWDWEWEERSGYWVRELRRSTSARGRYA